MSVSHEENFKIIKLMEKEGSPESYFDKWKSIRNQFRQTLNSGSYRQEAAFTPHDYDRHCVNIYNIINSILLSDADVPGEDINIEHLFILNVAVILHDIYMAFDPEKRASHSQHARDFVIDKFQEKGLPIDSTQAKCIGDVIYGHSDVKGVTQEYSIDKLPSKKDSLVGLSSENINVKLLSSLLRLADELDENSRRIYGANPSDFGIVRGDESWRHWRKCELLNFPRKHPDDQRVIQLVVNDEKLKSEGSYPTDHNILNDVRYKINKELKLLNDKVFSGMDGLKNWKFQSVEFKASPNILEELEKAEKKTKDPLIEAPEGVRTLETIKAVDEDFEKTLTGLVFERGFIKSGHYQVDFDGNYCARDWIDTNALLENAKIRKQIVKKFFDRLGSNECNLIGIGQNGILLASLLGVYSNNPFSYIIPEKFKKFNVDTDNTVSLVASLPIVLITDVIVTGKTIKESIRELVENNGVLEDRITHIYSVFVRTPIHASTRIEIPYAEKVFSLNSVIGIEICLKPNCLPCIFRDNQFDLYKNNPQEI